MIWTDEAVEELKRMWDRGMTTGQIAKALNVTKNSIIGKVHRLCLTARPSPIKKVPAKKAPAAKKESSKPVKESRKTSVAAPVTKKEEKNTPQTASFVEETNIPLVKLDNHTCRWPLGDPRDDDFCFCGKKVKTGQTYCEEHSAVAYVKAGRKI
ncbi:MAG: global cell cycle regulator GcrA-like protein [Alphaproteobacteria bacterium]|nr:global cell cycle regulator GcrA-like protein [Alphaproteobacteria bacterium]